MAGKKYNTPLLDELEKASMAELCHRDEEGRARRMRRQMMPSVIRRSATRPKWDTGNMVESLTSFGYGGGVIGRYSELGNEFPGVAHFHTVRINQPSGFFYTGKALKEICDIWDKYGSGLTNVHGSTGDLVLLGTKTEHLKTFSQNILRAAGTLRFRISAQNSELLGWSCLAVSGPIMIPWISHITTQEFPG